MKQRKMYAYHATRRKGAGPHKDRRDKRNKRKFLWRKELEQ